MVSCYSGDHIARYHIHTCNIEEPQQSTALEQSVKDNWDGEGGELTLVLSDPKPRPHLLNNFQTHYIFWASIDVNDLNFPRSAMGHIKR